MTRVGGAPRLLRLQADERLARLLRPASSPREGGWLDVPTRAAVEVGDMIRVEVSFGAFVDEVILHGYVCSVARRGERAPLVALRLIPEHEPRVRYIQEVLAERRAASARATRRVNSEVRAIWRWQLGTHTTQIGDISKGGAFIRSGAPPSVGAGLELELEDPRGDNGLRLEATVAWTGRSQGHRGFGVKFRITDRQVANRVADLVRWHERNAADAAPSL